MLLLVSNGLFFIFVKHWLVWYHEARLQTIAFMSLTASIARNTFVQVLGKGASVLLAVVSIGIVTRYLGQAGYGQYTTSLAFVEFFGVLADLGLYIIAVKKISEAGVDADRVYSNIFTLRLVSALIFVGLAPLVVLFFPYPSIVKVGVLVTTFSNLFVALNQLLVGLYQRYLAMGKAALSEAVSKIVFLVAIVVAVQMGGSVLMILFASVLTSAAQFFLLFWFSRRLTKIRLRFEWVIWRMVLKESWPVALSIALNLIYFRADTIILSLFHSEATVGLYGASYKVLTVLIAFPAMFAGLVLPLLSQHFSQGNTERFRAVLQKAFDFLSLVALPMVAGIVLFAHPIMELIAGKEFSLSGSILRVLIFAAGSIFLGNLFGNAAVAIGQQRRMTIVYLLVAIVGLTGYLLLIPRYGVWGASGMTLVTEFMIMAGSMFVVLRSTRLRLSLHQFGRAFLACAVMVAVLFPFRGQHLFVLIAAGALLYITVLLLTGAMNRQMLRDLMQSR